VHIGQLVRHAPHPRQISDPERRRLSDRWNIIGVCQQK